MPAIDIIEKQKRIRAVQEWILDDWPTTDILKVVMDKWGLEERQAYRYIAIARKRWQDEKDELVNQRRRIKILQLKKLKRSLGSKFVGTPSGINAVLNVEKELIMLEGLAPARKVELSGPDGTPIQTEHSRVILYIPANGRDGGDKIN